MRLIAWGLSLPRRVVSGTVAMSWVVVLMVMVLVPSAVQWAWGLLAAATASPVRVVRTTLAAWLGQACCRSYDPIDHIMAVNRERCDEDEGEGEATKADPGKWLVAETHRVASDGAVGHVMRVDRVYR
jgi:hypothetical protein